MRRTPVETAARDCDDLPLADTRAYWLQRREALHLRLDRLYLKTGTHLPALTHWVIDGYILLCGLLSMHGSSVALKE